MFGRDELRQKLDTGSRPRCCGVEGWCSDSTPPDPHTPVFPSSSACPERLCEPPVSAEPLRRGQSGSERDCGFTCGLSDLSGASPARPAWLQVHGGGVLRQDQRRVPVPAGPVPQVGSPASSHFLQPAGRGSSFWFLFLLALPLMTDGCLCPSPASKWSTTSWPMRRRRCSVTTSW